MNKNSTNDDAVRWFHPLAVDGPSLVSIDAQFKDTSDQENFKQDVGGIAEGACPAGRSLAVGAYVSTGHTHACFQSAGLQNLSGCFYRASVVSYLSIVELDVILLHFLKESTWQKKFRVEPLPWRWKKILNFHRWPGMADTKGAPNIRNNLS